MITLVDCPRDAMQGIERFIPTDIKVAYLNKLLRVGFTILDCGSFVSPKAVPQMQDTAAVLSQLNLENISTRLLAIVANHRGAIDACNQETVDIIGFPLSVSETFQRRNTNKTIAEALKEINMIQQTCRTKGKDLVVYLSMAFGNPYKDEWNSELVGRWLSRLYDLGISKVSLADTIGSAEPGTIRQFFTEFIPKYPEITIGAHLHSNPSSWREKIDAAYSAGCRWFDGAVRGFGGCPFAKDELVGNVASENIISYLEEKGNSPEINHKALQEAIAFSSQVFKT